MAEEVRGNVAAEPVIIRADERDAVALREPVENVENGYAGGVDLPHRLVHFCFVHGHEYDCVGPLRDRLFHECDLLCNAVWYPRHVMLDPRTEPGGRPLRAEARCRVRRIRPILGEYREPGLVHGSTSPSRKTLRVQTCERETVSTVLALECTPFLCFRKAPSRLPTDGARCVRTTRLAAGVRSASSSRQTGNPGSRARMRYRPGRYRIRRTTYPLRVPELRARRKSCASDLRSSRSNAAFRGAQPFRSGTERLPRGYRRSTRGGVVRRSAAVPSPGRTCFRH